MPSDNGPTAEVDANANEGYYFGNKLGDKLNL
jgi:hypothetical protein